MATPTPQETRAFLEHLRDQASFLEDPALIDALHFIERIAEGQKEDEDDDADLRSRKYRNPH